MGFFSWVLSKVGSSFRVFLWFKGLSLVFVEFIVYFEERLLLILMKNIQQKLSNNYRLAINYLQQFEKIGSKNEI